MARSFIASVATLVLGFLMLCALPSEASAATAQAMSLAQPSWAELKPQEKQILAPLAKDWDGLESFRRKKWRGIAQRYPTMKPEEQQRVSAQMKTWAAMSPEDRNLARQKFKMLHSESPEQRESRRQQWSKYQALSESEKKKFRDKAGKKHLQKTAEPRPAPRPLTRSTSTPAKTPAAPLLTPLSGTAAAQ